MTVTTRTGLFALRLVLMVTMLGSLLAWGWSVGRRAAAQRADRAAWATTLSAAQPSVAEPEVVVPASVTPSEGSLFGVIRAERLGIDASIREGVSAPTLDVAVGRVPGTSARPEAGNLVLAAHRDTYFSPLRRVRPGDRIEVRTRGGRFTYVVEGGQVVDPSDVWVMDPTPDPTLTLITCYPFSFVGPAPQRFVVRARLETPTSTDQAGS